ncbi:hypothetical protein ABFS82_13G164100 [Erythranthe guttata]
MTKRTDTSASQTASASVTQQEPTFKPGKKKSEVWKHYHYKMNEDGSYVLPVKAVCNYCRLEYPCRSKSYGTTNMRYHVYNACLQSPVLLDRNQTQSVLTNSTKGELIPLHYDKDYARKKLIQMIIIDELPFNMVEGAGFRAFCQSLNAQFLVPSHPTIARGVMSCFLEEKAKLKSILGSGVRVSLTTDTWTSIQTINYMAITAHFLDDDWNLHKRIISFSQIANHSGDTISKALEQCLCDWGVVKVFAIVVDNASANTKALDIFKERLARSKGLVFRGTYLHVRCCCHVLNLIVQSGMKVLNESIEGIRLAVKWVKASPQRLEKFREYARDEGIEGQPMVCLDVCTRWNSTYLMLVHALKFSKVFNMLRLLDSGYQDYFKDHNNARCPDFADWESAKEFVSFLKVFYEATLKLSASKTPTAHLVFKQLLNIQTLLTKETEKSADEALHKVAASMKTKFQFYWGKWEKVNYFLYLAVVLDPRYKLPYLSFQLKNIGMEIDMVLNLEAQVKQMLRDMFKEYGLTMTKNNQSNVNGEAVDDDPIVEESGSNSGDEDDVDMLYHQSLKKSQIVALSDEVDRYLHEPYLETKKSKFKILQYWKAESFRFPILAKIAKDIFAMPVSSVASECAFSLGSRVVDPFRSRLTPRTVEALVCTNDWLKGDGFSYYKDPTEIEMEIYSTLEELEKEALSTQNLQEMPSAPRSSTQASTSTV